MINFDFLFWIFFVGLVIATMQDLKRREVDDWLNLFLIVSSFSFVFLRVYFESNAELAYLLLFSLAVMFALMNAFYYGHIFAGGDAKLLFAMTAFFLGSTFLETMINIGSFTLFLLLSGSVYGLGYSFVLYFKNFKKVNAGIKKEFGSGVIYSFVAGVILFALSFFSVYFFILTIFAFVFPFLYVFAKGLENVSMIKVIKGSGLREGDWLAGDVKVGDKTIKASWDGVSLEEMKVMKNLNRVKIKEGMPFVPAFLIAFLAYVYLKDVVFGILFGAL